METRVVATSVKIGCGGKGRCGRICEQMFYVFLKKVCVGKSCKKNHKIKESISGLMLYVFPWRREDEMI